MGFVYPSPTFSCDKLYLRISMIRVVLLDHVFSARLRYFTAVDRLVDLLIHMSVPRLFAGYGPTVKDQAFRFQGPLPAGLMACTCQVCKPGLSVGLSTAHWFPPQISDAAKI